MLQAIATGQAQIGGLAALQRTSKQPRLLSASSSMTRTSRAACRPADAGLAAIFTDHVTLTHVIRRVVLRQTGILNYINPF